jgi:oligogalacturonide transporter
MKPTERRVGYGTAIRIWRDGFIWWRCIRRDRYLAVIFLHHLLRIIRFRSGIDIRYRPCDRRHIKPIMGYITDNFANTWLGKKFGRRRFFLLISAPMMFLYALVWVTDMSYWYYLGTYLSIELLSAMCWCLGRRFPRR